LAISWYNRALQLDTKSLLTHIYLIDQYILQDDLSLAQSYLDSLVNIAPDWGFTLSMAAKLEMFKNNFKSARNNLDQSISLTNAEKEYDYAYTLIKLNKIVEAKTILVKELELYLGEIGNNPQGSSSNEKGIADIYSLLDNKGQAIIYLNKAVQKGWIDYY